MVHMIARCLLLALCWIMVCGAVQGVAAQTNDSVLAECKEPRQRMASILENARSKPILDQYRELVQFYDSVGEDPPNCVTLDILDQLDLVEEQLVTLTQDGSSIKPVKVLHCERIN